MAVFIFMVILFVGIFCYAAVSTSGKTERYYEALYTPKPPIVKKPIFFTGEKWIPADYDIYHCPNCDNKIPANIEYCNYCHQAMDWGITYEN